MSDIPKLIDLDSGNSDGFSYVLVDDPGHLQLRDTQALLRHDGERSMHQPSAFDDAHLHQYHFVRKDNLAVIGPSDHLHSFQVSNHGDHPAANEQCSRGRQQMSIRRDKNFDSSLQVPQRLALPKNQQITEWLAACRCNNLAGIENLPTFLFVDSGLGNPLGDNCPVLLATTRPINHKRGDISTPEMLRGVGAWTWDRGSRR